MVKYQRKLKPTSYNSSFKKSQHNFLCLSNQLKHIEDLSSGMFYYEASEKKSIQPTMQKKSKVIFLCYIQYKGTHDTSYFRPSLPLFQENKTCTHALTTPARFPFQ
jgi:hypothetical protein